MEKKRQFNELIKDFGHVRSYMQDMFIKGFLTRGDFEGVKSAGTYDNEKRRIQSYLGEWMESGMSESKKTNYISIDSRSVEHSPLFRAWKSKSFTDKDITLHFILFDILYGGKWISFPEIVKRINEDYTEGFKNPYPFDEKTIRLKLMECEDEGLLKSKREGRTNLYALDNSFNFGKYAARQNFIDALNFFTEMLPCGVVGSFILEKIPVKNRKSPFTFKHHYILHALDAEIEYMIFEAIRKKMFLKLQYNSKKSKGIRENNVMPLKIFQSVENGRFYLAASESRKRTPVCIRIDRIRGIEECGHCGNVERRRNVFDKVQSHVWGAAFPGNYDAIQKTTRVWFTLKFKDDEEYIWNRLQREKRCGFIERIDRNNARFWADLYDPGEIKPWVRMFIGRITGYDFGDDEMNRDFQRGIERMFTLYEV